MGMIQMNSTGARMGAPARQEVAFKDGTAVLLHGVVDNAGHPDTFARHCYQADAFVAYLDLRELAPELEGVLPGATTSDTAFAVFHTLRRRYGSANEFRQAVGAPAP